MAPLDALEHRVRERTPLLWAAWKTARPAQLLLVLAVYALGVKAAVALGATVAPSTVLVGALALLPLAASIHYTNEYADHETDALTDRTPFSGGSGALVATGLSRRFPGALAVAALVVGVAVSAIGLVTRLPPVAVGLLTVIVVFGWQYSVGPLRLAWRGLGEVDNALLGGLVLPTYGAAVAAGPSETLGTVALASVPFTLLVFANLLATQWPDREADRRVGKHTLTSRLPRRRARWLYAAVVSLAGLSVLALWGRVLPPLVAGASLLVVPLVGWGLAGFPRDLPTPSVVAMVALAVVQLVAWCVVGL